MKKPVWITILVVLISFQAAAFAAFYNVGAFWRPKYSQLEVPIELFDSGLESSAAGAYTFASTRTSLDTTYYDGAVTYSFEIVATNSDTVARTVSLVDSSGTVVATVSIPASTNKWTRIRTTFTPTTGASDYRVQTSASTADSDVVITAARILVKQVGATKTRLYFPLLADDVGNTNTTETPVDADTGTSWYITPINAPRWLKDSANLATLASSNPWTLEAILSSDSTSATASIGLFQYGTSTQVTGSTASTTATTPTLVSASFADTAANFTNSSEFWVQVKSSAGTHTASIYKAGIWITLSSITNGEAVYRLGRSISDTSVGLNYMTGQRGLLDTTLFSNPTVYFEDTSECVASGCGTTRLYSDGTADSGTSGTSLIVSNTPGTSYTRNRSSSVSITAGNRFLGGYNLSSGTLNIVSEYAVITFQ